jgi:hypothetical protein
MIKTTPMKTCDEISQIAPNYRLVDTSNLGSFAISWKYELWQACDY